MNVCPKGHGLKYGKSPLFILFSGVSHTDIRGAYIICNADIIPIGYIIRSVRNGYHSLHGRDKLRFMVMIPSGENGIFGNVENIR